MYQGSRVYVCFCCLTSTKASRPIRDGTMKVGEREITYLSLHCHHQNDTCIKMGSDESHFNVSSIVKDKVTAYKPQAC